jgi:opacity protein-like surface antigen
MLASALLLIAASPAPAQAGGEFLEPASSAGWSGAVAARRRDAGEGYWRVGAGLVRAEDSSGPDEDIEFDQGPLLSLAIGQRMLSRRHWLNFDLELEGFWNRQDTDDGSPIQALRDVSVGGAFANGMLDARLGGRLSLYAGAGAGAAWLDVDTVQDALFDFDDEEGPFFAWQAKAGLAWELSERASLSLGYRYVQVEDLSVDDSLSGADFELETAQQALELGLRLRL